MEEEEYRSVSASGILWKRMDVFVCQREFGVRRRLEFIAICRLLPMYAQPAVSSRPNSQNIARMSLKISIRQFVRTIGPNLAEGGGQSLLG
ncbi:unnamed protein product [Enterobius vermicularis]|uniref:Uncharacterized protein n=1 Tax=Enterobius vermicularis TaxID=51028 RepID=A0A0N4VRL9_ENTVE|nr:unnamed protein product [Enterobius vermicularis]